MQKNMEKGFEMMTKTLQQIQGNFDQIDSKFDQIDSRFVKIDSRFDQIDSRFDKMDRRFDSLEQNVEDNTTSIQYLIRDGIMRVECEEMIDRKLREQLEPMESRILSAFDNFLGQHTMLKEEVISNRYRLSVIEKTIGLSNAL